MVSKIMMNPKEKKKFEGNPIFFPGGRREISDIGRGGHCTHNTGWPIRVLGLSKYSSKLHGHTNKKTQGLSVWVSACLSVCLSVGLPVCLLGVACGVCEMENAGSRQDDSCRVKRGGDRVCVSVLV